MRFTKLGGPGGWRNRFGVAVAEGRQRAGGESGDTALPGLVAAMARRDQAALGRLYDLSIDRVYATALRIVRNEADAEEVAADVYQQAWQRASAFDPERGSVMTWLLGMAWSRAVDRVRRERRHRRCEPLHPERHTQAYALPDADPAAAMIETLASAGGVTRALGTLSAVQRRLVSLAFREQLSHAEIAQRERLPLGTVKSHLRRGLASLRRALRIDEERGGG